MRTKEHSSILFSRHLSTLLLNAHDQRQNYVIQGRSTNRIVACRLPRTLTLTDRLLSCVRSRRILFVSNHKMHKQKEQSPPSRSPLQQLVATVQILMIMWYALPGPANCGVRSLTSVLLLHSSAEDQKNKFLPHTGQASHAVQQRIRPVHTGMSTRLASLGSGTAT